MILTIIDRISISNQLPAKGSYTDLVIRRDILGKVALTQEDFKNFGVKTEGDKISWDDKKAKDIEVEFSELEMIYLKDRFKEFEEKKELTSELLETYEKIME